MYICAIASTSTLTLTLTLTSTVISAINLTLAHLPLRVAGEGMDVDELRSTAPDTGSIAHEVVVESSACPRRLHGALLTEGGALPNVFSHEAPNLNPNLKGVCC